MLNKNGYVSKESVCAEIARFKGYLDDDMIYRLQMATKRLPDEIVEVLPADYDSFYRKMGRDGGSIMQLIKLHTKEGDEIYINVNAIESMRYVPANAKTVMTMRGCEDGWFNIQEAPEEILQMIRGGE